MKDDWRLTNQEEYLTSVVLKRIKYNKYSDSWEHEHCEFCWEKISENKSDFNEAYCTLDEQICICEDCYNDFKEMFNWRTL